MSTPPNEPTPKEDPVAPEEQEPDETPTRREPTGPPAPPPGAGTGQHAAPRPYPPSAPGGPAGPPPAAPAAAWTPTQGAERPTGPPPSTAAPVGAAAPVARRDAPPARGTDAVLAEGPARDLPEPPTRPGMGRQLLAGLLGFVLTPFALTMVGIGTGRLADIAGTTDMGTDLLGGTLLSLGVLMLAVIVLLGTWSAALPIVGGLVWGIGLGAAYLIAPSAMRDGAEAMTADGTVPVEVEQLADAGMSGSLLVLGALLVAAGLAVSLARRRGRLFAERVAVAERAREDADREGPALRTR